jgi:hypothetical protein
MSGRRPISAFSSGLGRQRPGSIELRRTSASALADSARSQIWGHGSGNPSLLRPIQNSGWSCFRYGHRAARYRPPVESIRPSSDVKLVPRCVGRGTDRMHGVLRAAGPTWTAGRDITPWGRRSSRRMPVAGDAGTSCIVAAQAPLPTGRLNSVRPKDDELRQMRGGPSEACW